MRYVVCLIIALFVLFSIVVAQQRPVTIENYDIANAKGLLVGYEKLDFKDGKAQIDKYCYEIKADIVMKPEQISRGQFRAVLIERQKTDDWEIKTFLSIYWLKPDGNLEREYSCDDQLLYITKLGEDSLYILINDVLNSGDGDISTSYKFVILNWDSKYHRFFEKTESIAN